MLVGFAAEVLKLRKRPAVWMIVAVWIMLAVVFGYLFPYLAYRSATGPKAALGKQALVQALPADLVGTAVQGFPLFAGALAMLLGVLATGGEYGWNTMKALLTQGPGRVSVVAGKALALVSLMLLVVLTSFAVDALCSVVTASITDSAMDWPGVSDLVRGIAGGWLIVTMWCLGGAFLGIAFRGTALAAGIGLVWALAIENLLRVFSSIVSGLDTVQKYLPGTNAGALAAALGSPTQSAPGGTPGVTTAVGGTQAGITLALYIVLFAVAASVLVKRRDIA
ncbi:MAG: ABC transporter permease subunit [Kutzneria sp.]|nr:ABC transporter permease subunit [Kutzneria sp.]MBV9845860.1 ABC transporter permease subunit [Kutzneria sp.]